MVLIQYSSLAGKLKKFFAFFNPPRRLYNLRSVNAIECQNMTTFQVFKCTGWIILKVLKFIFLVDNDLVNCVLVLKGP